MKENKKLIFDAFAHLFLLMAENETDNVELTFDFNKINAKFKVEVVSLEDKRKDKIENQEPCVGIVQHEEVTLLKQDYDAMVEREETLIKKLADAEHEIENYQHELEVYKHNDNIYSSNIIKMNNNAKRNKIDFAVEWLEKVRKTIKTLHGQKNCKIGNSYIQKKDKLYNKYIIELDILEEVLEIFDNQIKQLREK